MAKTQSRRTVTITTELYERMAAHRDYTGISISELVERALADENGVNAAAAQIRTCAPAYRPSRMPCFRPTARTGI